MEAFNRSNLDHIITIFEAKTGTTVSRRVCRPLRALPVLAAVLALLVTLAAFTDPLFSPLDGDALTLGAVYEGSGIVHITIDNGSERNLILEEELKLINWETGEEVTRRQGSVLFSERKIMANSSETITVDLSDAYEISSLENHEEGYYLLLTNNGFLFGHDWICSISFSGETDSPEETESEPLPPEPVEEDIAAAIAEELKFYFEDSYEGPYFTHSEHTMYTRKVRELLEAFSGNVVSSSDTMLIVGRTPEGVVFDETYPADRQYELVGEHNHMIDGYGRIIGASESEYALTLSALLPSRKGEVGGGTYIPLIYMFVYEKASIQSMDDCAFIYGQLHSFAELEPYKVCETEEHVVYEITNLMYTDLRAYTEYYISRNSEGIYFDDQVWKRIENIYKYYKDKDNYADQFYYNLPQ